ncbi:MULTISPECIES: TetR/AcrR family transcriptional regulator [Rhodococcus]|uniref:TetR family transcriptional regulator n=1 Tax=Rhodococcus oxybenzonivorans TaxID=1990687 RepID=A0AAE4UZ64_9NOCA|nr:MULTISPECIES: TetR family transcriptional regulator [Rhodococcus]MDV7241851.1 TetR family transcriptional regulator [Rhodococcus oxybenzonivorans]MDV7265495.1 TetR family transcriptional regulator [Rhodococcus oxybenzonivorans]MDV7273615.1 TetR family transcriptional regulator [Rhodococcus oxybenzonivorans]MDV7334133.1 TetR family transcriptional regulator [Rhodococcus oxybenzonivorans]MDV7343552.1 TetR family transcriptional regulator [Rhodococcus oxybenzonivorans]
MGSNDHPATVDESGTPSRKTPGRPPSLTEDQIVDAALEIIRSEGLDALSMRRLSQQLGRSQMAAYSYVADKQELLDLVAQRTLADVGIPDESVGLWDCRLRMLIDGIDSQLRRNPGIAGLLLQRMLHSDRRLVDAFMAILLSAGLREPQVLLSYAMIHTYLFGRYQVALADVPHDATDLPPALAQVTPHLAGLHGTDYYTFGIETLIDGLRARVADNAPEAS